MGVMNLSSSFYCKQLVMTTCSVEQLRVGSTCLIQQSWTLDQWVIDATLNRLSSIQPTTVEQYMKRYWGRE